MPEFRGGRVYSFASLHHALQLEDDAGGRLPSFCTQGGEFLVAVRAGLLGEPAEEADEARAYLFACDLPWESLEHDDVDYVVRTVLLDVLTSMLPDRNYSMHGDRECLTTRQDVVPAWITKVADVEDLKFRRDLVPADIHWTSLGEKCL